MIDDTPRDSQFSAHNKAPDNARRIRMSWMVVVLLFLLIGLTGAYIIGHAG